MNKHERLAGTTVRYLEEIQKAIERNEVKIHDVYIPDTVFEIHVRNANGDIMTTFTQAIMNWEGVDELEFDDQTHVTIESVSAFFHKNTDCIFVPFLSDEDVERAHSVEFVIGDKMINGEWDDFVLSISITI